MLKKMNKNEFIVPCYDIDLMWHTHQVHPINYAEDTKEFLGYLFPHDDSTNDRSEGSVLSNSFASTVKQWKSWFMEDYSRPGSMYRGCDPHGKLMPITTSILDEMVHAKTRTLSLKKVSLSRHVLPRLKLIPGFLH